MKEDVQVYRSLSFARSGKKQVRQIPKKSMGCNFVLLVMRLSLSGSYSVPQKGTFPILFKQEQGHAERSEQEEGSREEQFAAVCSGDHGCDGSFAR